jgi:predicted N-formylglutamate amidohydrolase
MPVVVEEHDAYEIVVGGRGDSRVVLICEHATNRLPDGWQWPDEDRWLVNQHWAVDLGIRQITYALADAIGATGVLARFSRLLVDPNRPIHNEDLFRLVADDRDVQLNVDLTDEKKAERINKLYRPYHDAIDRVVDTVPGVLVLSLHSFTPVYEGAPPRWMELGVLFDREESLARRVEPLVRRHGLVTALNEPYTGKGGLIYSAEVHADRVGRRALEIEVRQDRAVDPAYRKQIVNGLADLCRGAVAEIDASQVQSRANL